MCKLKLIASISRHVAEAGGGDLRNSKFSRAVVGRACSHAMVSGYLRGRVWCLGAGIYGLRAFIIGLLFCDMQSLKFQFS